MSWPAMSWAITQKLRTPDKMVLLLLAYRENPDTEVADVSILKLAADAGMSRSGVKSALQRLTDAELIEVEHRRVDSDRNLPNLYRLNYGGRGREATPGEGPAGDPRRGQQATPKAGSNNACSGNAGAKLDLSSWPEQPSEKFLNTWLEVRKKKRAPVNEQILGRMGRELHEAVKRGWTVDQVLEECGWRNWQGFRADWLEPKPGYEKPQPARAGAGSKPPHGRADYAQGARSGNFSRPTGGAIDRVLGNARGRAEAAATDGTGPDSGDDDGGLRPPLDFDPR